MAKENFKAYLAWITVCIVWGTTYLAIRIGVKDLPPMLFAGLRWIIAGVIFLIFLKGRGQKLPGKKDLIPLAIVGLALLGIGNGLVVVGEQWINSGLTALLITTTPFWFIGIEAFLPHKPKINFFVIAGLLLGLVGVTLIFGSHWQELLNSSYLLGALCIMGAVIAWALGSVYSKYKKIDLHPLMSAATQMIIAGVAQAVLGLLLGEAPEFNLTGNGLWAFVYLTLVGSIFGYGSYIYAISHLPLSFVSTYAYINPVIALFLGWLVLDERLDFIILISAVIIIAGVLLVKQGSKIQNIFPRSGDSDGKLS
ncbi:MAG: multidrug DMT transporter permease [Ignavibacteria bacterium RIFOXYB2_FULL_36_7]|nr:MAG: multidrug DMT transporter permease [Ignavibacteria bacterium RIFOXYB2_FULL_36_7]